MSSTKQSDAAVNAVVNEVLAAVRVAVTKCARRTLQTATDERCVVYRGKRTTVRQAIDIALDDELMFEVDEAMAKAFEKSCMKQFVQVVK